jgi:hypothetical protein
VAVVELETSLWVLVALAVVELVAKLLRQVEPRILAVAVAVLGV